MDENEARWIRELHEGSDLLWAMQMVANRGMKIVGFNNSYEFAPGMTVTYELLDRGPEHIYPGQYRYLAEFEYGTNIDPAKDGLSGDELFWAMEKAYRKIVVRDGDRVVGQMEGKGGFHLSTYVEGPWEKEIVNAYQAQKNGT